MVEGAPQPRAEVMAGLAKGLRVIESFTVKRPAMTITEAARASGLSAAVARRCLLTLEELGYLSHDGKYFRPTPRMARLGATVLEIFSLPSLAQPHLEAIRDEFGEATSLAVLDGSTVTFVARAETNQVVSSGVRVGVHMPAYNSATGRVLLSALPEAGLEELLRSLDLPPGGALSAAEVRKRVDRARAEDQAFDDSELQPGVRSVAVPVLDQAGRMHAALSVATLREFITVEYMTERYVPVMRAEAARLGAKL